MIAKRPVLVLALLIGSLASPATAAAVTCGTVTKKGVVRGTLTLDKDSVSTVDYGRETNPKTLLLTFGVGVCDIPARPPPDMVVLPRQGADELPDGAVTMQRSRVAGNELSVLLRVDPDRFDPG